LESGFSVGLCFGTWSLIRVADRRRMSLPGAVSFWCSARMLLMNHFVLGVVACSVGLVAGCSSSREGIASVSPSGAEASLTPSVDPAAPARPEPPRAIGPGVPESNVAEVENRGSSCKVPALPSYDQLPSIPGLPDPFSSMDGTRISTRSAWTCGARKLREPCRSSSSVRSLRVPPR
jgi:hypothetical protein